MRTAYEYGTESNIIRLLTETKDGEIICDLQYAYDLNGNRTAKTETMMLLMVLKGKKPAISMIYVEIGWKKEREKDRKKPL